VVGELLPARGSASGEEQLLEMAARFAALFDPIAHLVVGKKCGALLRRADVKGGVGPESGKPDVGQIPLAAFEEDVARLKLRLKFRGSIGMPCRVVKTSPVSIQAAPARAWSASCCRLRILSAVTHRPGRGKSRPVPVRRDWKAPPDE